MANLAYPILGDVKKIIARDYGVLREDLGFALRGTFIIDPASKIRWMQVNDLDQGRDIGEVIRVLDALQSGGLCPIGWKKGDKHL